MSYFEGNPSPEEWWLSPHQKYAIVSNYPTGHDDRSSLEVYGGHLICKSVVDPSTMDKILALPKLLRAVKALLAPYSQDTGRLSTPEMVALKKAYEEATGIKIKDDPFRLLREAADKPVEAEPEELNEPEVEAYGIPEAPNTSIFIEDDVRVEPLTPEMFEAPKKGPLKLGSKTRVVPMDKPDYADDEPF